MQDSGASPTPGGWVLFQAVLSGGVRIVRIRVESNRIESNQPRFDSTRPWKPAGAAVSDASSASSNTGHPSRSLLILPRFMYSRFSLRSYPIFDLYGLKWFHICWESIHVKMCFKETFHATRHFTRPTSRLALTIFWKRLKFKCVRVPEVM